MKKKQLPEVANTLDSLACHSDEGACMMYICTLGM